MGEGSPGIDLRVLDDQAVVTHVDPGSPAEKAGVKPGWAVFSVDGKELAPAIQKLKADRGHPRTHTRARGAGAPERADWREHPGGFLEWHRIGSDAAGSALWPRRAGGSRSSGICPTMHVWAESKKLGNTGYIRFNMFLDLVHVMASFSDAVNSCLHAMRRA